MERYVGVDVSLKETSICVVDGSGEMLSEGTVIPGPSAIAKYLKTKAGSARRIGLETADAGPCLQARLRELAGHPPVGDVRGVGMAAAIELVEAEGLRRPIDPARKVGETCRDACAANGAVIRAIGGVMAMSPPLIISRAEIDGLVASAARRLDETAAALGV